VKRLEVTFTRQDGSEVTAHVWGLAPRVTGHYAETYWILLDHRFVLVAKRRGEKDGPFREVLTVAPNQRLEVAPNGWFDPQRSESLTA
jgi:hypothetical protein